MRPRVADAASSLRGLGILNLLATEARFVEPIVAVHDCRDPKDDKYLALALAAEAATIVSSDHDLLTLDPWRNVRVLLPRDYLQSIEARRQERFR